MEYLLKVSAVIIIFYGIYKLFLQRDTFFESNRWFLLIGLISSCFIPFIVIPIYTEYTPTFYTIGESEPFSAETFEKPISLLDYLPFVYGIGVSFLSVRFILQLLSLAKIINYNKNVKKDGFVFIETKDNTSPFSFFKWIVYNPKTFTETELEHIIEHEKTHAKQYHSVDILISQLFCIILWFNPFMWFYNKDLKQNLEFIADKRTLNQYNCKKSYQYTLLKTSMPSHQMALSNHFYNSLIKKRIVMLHKSKSKKINQLKYALVIPVLLGFLISCNSEVSDPIPESNALLPSADEKSSSVTIKGQTANGLTPLFFVDGKEIPQDEVYKLNENDILSINVLKDEKYTSKYGEKAKNGVVEIITKQNTNSFEGKPMSDVNVIADNVEVIGAKSHNIKFSPKFENRNLLIVIDEQIMSNKSFEDINQDIIQTMTVLNPETATKQYGNKAKNGALIITSKK